MDWPPHPDPLTPYDTHQRPTQPMTATVLQADCLETMKKSEHKTSTLEVLQFLLDGPARAEDIGAHFWPDKVGMGPSRGGPASVAVAASRFLGRLRQKRYVAQEWDGWRKWYLTDGGHEFIRKHA